MMPDLKKYDIIENSEDSFEKCKALCDVGMSFYFSMTDAMLYIKSSKEKTIKTILHCFNEIFEYHAFINQYSQAILTYYLSNEITHDLIKEWTDKSGNETEFFDYTSISKYEDFEVIEVDYQLGNHQINSLKLAVIAFNNIRNTCLVLKENNTFFVEYNDEINIIIDKYWNELEF